MQLNEVKYFSTINTTHKFKAFIHVLIKKTVHFQFSFRGLCFLKLKIASTHIK